MLEDGRNAKRSVVPRWRSLRKTPSHETRPVKPTRRSAPVPVSHLDDAVACWNEARSLENASEVIDAALTYGKYDIAADAARFVLDRSAQPVRGLRSAAQQVLGYPTRDHAEFTSIIGNERRDKIHSAIRNLKQRLIDSPRDVITCLEIGRLQALLGQNDAAERYVVRAARQEPNNRYVLRSLTRFFVHIEAPEQALEFINRSDAVRTDPWIQAAEVATSDLADVTPRWGSRQIRSLSTQGGLGIEYSELAAGLATLELKNGAKRRFVSRLLTVSLQDPTENSLAQAVWVNEVGHTKADVRTQVNQMPSAHEARVRAAYDEGNGTVGAREAWHWLADQPLSLLPALLGSHFTGTLLCDYKKSLDFLEIASMAHPYHPSILNNKIVALCYMNDIDGARLEMSHFEKYVGMPQVEPFVQAARGLIAFRSGDPVTGREHYRASIETTKRMKISRLTYYAYLYWFEQEVYCGYIKGNDCKSLINSFDHKFEDCPKEFRTFVRQTWRARKPILEKFADGSLHNNCVFWNCDAPPTEISTDYFGGNNLI